MNRGCARSVFRCHQSLIYLLILAAAGDIVSTQENRFTLRAAENAAATQSQPANTPERIWIPQSRLSDGPHVRAAFVDAIAGPGIATVRVRSDDKDVTLGGIVGQDGWILTKASCLRGHNITCRLSDGRELDAQMVGVQREHDLAMLKVPANQLPVLNLERETSVEVGQWVATVGTDQTAVAVGIVSVASRAIPRRPGILGVQLNESPFGPRVVRVFGHTGAAEAGILINDVITSINGEATRTRGQLQRVIRRHSPGDEIHVVLRRGTVTFTVRAVLTGKLPVDHSDREDFQNRLGGQLSQRRFGFPAAFQHDTVLKPSDCGGPVVDLDGNVVGFNIARAGRTESYAIPVSVIVEMLYDLMSGNLSPTRVVESPSAETSEFE